MAQRRMFSQKIVGSDAFLEMPTSTRELYFQLGMEADDDGFANPRKIMRITGASDDDLKMLIVKRFVLPFENGVIVVKHWRINNELKKDRYKPTQYLEQKKTLFLKDNGAYTQDENQGVPLLETGSSQNGDILETQDSIGKDSVGKESKDTALPAPKKRFVKPTLEEVKAYCKERGNSVDPQRFVNYYESKGWLVGKSPMKDWKAAVRTWEQNRFDGGKKPEGVKSGKYAKYDKRKT